MPHGHALRCGDHRVAVPEHVVCPEQALGFIIEDGHGPIGEDEHLSIRVEDGQLAALLELPTPPTLA